MKKYILLIFIMLFFINSQYINAQVLDHQTRSYEKNKIQIFTPEERSNLYDWFEKRMTKMHLSENKKEEYYSIILYYNVKMSRLDDKDANLSKIQVIKELDKLIAKQNTEIKEILSSEQYQIHLDNYNRLLESIKTRIADTDEIKK